VDLHDGVDAEAMLQDALDAGVAYLPGTWFYTGDDDRGRTRIRLSFSHAPPAEMEAGVERLAEQVRARMGDGD